MLVILMSAYCNTNLLPYPEPPVPSDCCGTGCSPCVYDIYENDLKIWKENCNRLNSNDSNIPLEELSTTEFKRFELIDIKQISEDTFIYIFKLPENFNFNLQIGQHLLIKGVLNNTDITRPYTPISDVSAKEMLKFLIKHYRSGKMSAIVSNWNIGDMVEIKGPFGSFNYRMNSYENIVMLAAGTGIAPMFQIINYVLQNDEDFTKIHLMYASRTYNDILLREELYALQSFWNLTVCHYLSRDDQIKDKKYSEKIKIHRIDKQDVKEQLLKITAENSLVLICGSKSFNKDMLNAVLDINEFTDKNIFRF